jgi:flagellin-like hook-associated protein FlgL
VAIGKTLSNTQDADMAKTAMMFSNEQAAYTAALRAGREHRPGSLLNFLH